MVAGEGWVRGGVCAARVKNVGDSDKGGGVEPQHRSGSCTARSYWCHDRAESPETAQAGTHCGSHRRQCLPVPQGPVPDRYQQPAVTLHQPGGTQRGGRPHRRMSKAGSAGKSWGRGVPGRIIGSGRPVGGGSESGSGRWLSGGGIYKPQAPSGTPTRRWDASAEHRTARSTALAKSRPGRKGVGWNGRETKGHSTPTPPHELA